MPFLSVLRHFNLPIDTLKNPRDLHEDSFIPFKMLAQSSSERYINHR